MKKLILVLLVISMISGCSVPTTPYIPLEEDVNIEYGGGGK